MYLRREIYVVWGECFAFKYIVCLFRNKYDNYLYSHKKYFHCVYNHLLVHNSHLYLYGQEENSSWILCSRKTGVKCG